MIDLYEVFYRAETKAIEAVCAAAGSDAAVVNFLKVLVENRRLQKLPRMIDLYEVFYRAEKGLVPCTVSSAAALSKSEMKSVQAAMQKRAGAGATLIMDYNTNANLLGGLMVKMGDAVYDNSVTTKLARLETQLLAPVA